MSDQPVEIVEYDPIWLARFAEQQVRLAVLLQPWLAAPIEHVGSTAVPGLQAKPVIDILAPVVSLAAAEQAIVLLEQDGWLFWSDDPNRDYRFWFLRPHPAARTHHLHVMQHDHPAAKAEIAFRDALRRDSDIRDAYAGLKRCLAEQHRTDRDAYTNAKSDFVESVLQSLGLAGSPRKPV